MTMYATGELKKLLNSRLATASVVPILYLVMSIVWDGAQAASGGT
ncbi:Hypothetical protein AA314_05546 [Archangium gephyra]|uniref:Uncharacterized protein n=1 Tax=Archangium gephyra TaxID=48 RepID=A0AAC8QAR2_9BACT|nr:Hypothetical protein AA314_05546 [Archangium gephyra]